MPKNYTSSHSFNWKRPWIIFTQKDIIKFSQNHVCRAARMLLWWLQLCVLVFLYICLCHFVFFNMFLVLLHICLCIFASFPLSQITCRAAGEPAMTSAACLKARLALCSPSAAITWAVWPFQWVFSWFLFYIFYSYLIFYVLYLLLYVYYFQTAIYSLLPKFHLK